MVDNPTYRASLINKIQDTIEGQLIKGMVDFFTIKDDATLFDSTKTYYKGDIVYWGYYDNQDITTPASITNSLLYATVADVVVNPSINDLYDTSKFIMVGDGLLSEIFNNNIFDFNNQSTQINKTPSVAFYYDPQRPLDTIADQWYQIGKVTARMIFPAFLDQGELVAFPTNLANRIIGLSRLSWLSFFEIYTPALIEFSVSSVGNYKETTLEDKPDTVDTFQFTLDFNYKVDRFKYYDYLSKNGIALGNNTKSMPVITDVKTNIKLI